MRRKPFPIVLGLLMIAAGASAFAQEEPPELLAEWPLTVGGRAKDVAVDSTGNVYVTDRELFRVFKFDANGNDLLDWHAVCPGAVGLDSTGYVYVSDDCGQKIHKYSPSGGDPVLSWPAPNPFGMTVDQHDNVHVSDYHGGQIRKFDSFGNLLFTWGTLGAGAGELCNPGGLFVDKDDSIWVTETGTCHRVQEFDALGNYITGWNCGDAGCFNYPSDVVVDRYGDVYVAEEWANRIQKFDNDGNFLVSWGGFDHPMGLALDDADNLYVVDRFNYVLKKYASPAVRLTCVGFEPPMASGPVTVRGNRALPFKAQLFDADGFEVTDWDVTVPPVVQVWYEYGTPDADDVTDEALPAGQSSEGNQFFFDSDQRWHYNLNTKNYSAAGTYTVFMESGDASEYVVNPTCVGEFVVR